MKSLALSALFVAATFISFSQETVEKKPAKLTEKTVPVQQTTPPKPISKDGPYMGKEEQIKEVLISGEIPADFPKHVEGQTPEAYKGIVRSWLLKHESLVKEEAYAKLLAMKEKKAAGK